MGVHSQRGGCLLIAGMIFSTAFGCSTVSPKNDSGAGPAANSSSSNSAEAAKSNGGAKITIDPNGPADTVRVFYKNLRDKKFREAIYLTNLRPAVEGLTEAELGEFAVDFEALAGQIPAEVQINGEIISGDQATVTANLPDPDEDGKNSIQEIKLKRSGDVWIIQTVDETAAAKIKKDGRSYFLNLRIETHEEEAKKMLERISKAQLAHSLQNGGVFTDMATLITAGLLPEDIASSASTGYNYAIKVDQNKISYFATATPENYGKSGRLSFLLQLDGKGISHVTSKDTRGQPMKK